MPLLDATGIHKSFGGVYALKGAQLRVSGGGVVHALAGENGSGKSTLLKVISGQVSPDAGSIALGGDDRPLRSAPDAVGRGIAMVSQETAVAPDLTVAENVLLGRRLVRGRWGVSRRHTEERAAGVLGQLKLDYDPRAVVRDLRPDQQQMVEIARAISMDARLLILDEPTSSLSDDAVEALFAAVEELKLRGLSVVLVSHRFDDMFRFADEITVLRDGETVHAGPMSSLTPRDLVAHMVGHPPEKSAGQGVEKDLGEPVLELDSVRIPGAVEDLHLRVRSGEVVGLAGLTGSGRSELLQALFGCRQAHGGVRLVGRAFSPSTPRDAMRCGVGFAPADRKTQSLLLGMSVRENLTIVRTAFRRRWMAPNAEQERAAAVRGGEAMRLRAASDRVAAGTLSGGNQQKVALGRWLSHRPRLLLLDEPTRGVDVAARADIHDRLRAVAREGAGLLVSSSENDELIDLCDRIIVLHRGRQVASLKAASTTQAEIARLAGGH